VGQGIVEQAPRQSLVSLKDRRILVGTARGGDVAYDKKKRADQLANALLEKEDFFSSVTRHPNIQRLCYLFIMNALPFSD